MQEHVTLKENLEALKQFKKEKSLGLNEWTVKLFLHFFDIMGQELLDLVEFSRTKGFVLGALNSTFITLVPKCNKPVGFADFLPISLCNILYKLI